MTRPLHGLKILAVEQYGAGPFGTQHLADLGAHVVKVENRKTGGDYARALGPLYVEGAEGSDASLFYQSINRNKKSLTLDLSRDEGRTVFRRLVRNFDAVTNNARGDVPEKLGLTYEQLRDANPAIVCAHCSAYGRTGPRRAWPGYDFLMQAEAGYFVMSGEPDSPPTRMGLSVVDFMAGTYMALGLVSAVLSARATGEGRDVDVNLFETALFNLSYLSAWALNSDYEPKRAARSAHATIVPCQLYKTADGWIYIMCNKEKFWSTLCDFIERPDLGRDPRYGDFAKRIKQRDALTEILDEALSARTTQDWLQTFAGKVPAAPILTPREALASKLVEDFDAFQSLTLEGGGSFDMLRSPIHVGTRHESDEPCPPLGANTVDELRAAGFSDAEIEHLSQDGII
jgi:succinate---hydroxymethylglutarate CoA-transferase